MKRKRSKKNMLNYREIYKVGIIEVFISITINCIKSNYFKFDFNYFWLKMRKYVIFMNFSFTDKIIHIMYYKKIRHFYLVIDIVNIRFFFITLYLSFSLLLYIFHFLYYFISLIFLYYFISFIFLYYTI